MSSPSSFGQEHLKSASEPVSNTIRTVSDEQLAEQCRYAIAKSFLDFDSRELLEELVFRFKEQIKQQT